MPARNGEPPVFTYIVPRFTVELLVPPVIPVTFLRCIDEAVVPAEVLLFAADLDQLLGDEAIITGGTSISTVNRGTLKARFYSAAIVPLTDSQARVYSALSRSVE